MIAKGLQQFKQEARVEEDNIQVLFEITLNNLSAEGDIDEQDFLDRADVLCSIGQTVLISNYQKYFKLVEFFSQHTKKRMGIIMGANTLSMVFDEKYYRNLNGGILEAFGILFSRDLKMYLYPWMDQPSGELWKVDNTPLHPRMQPLFDYLRFNKRIIDIPYDEDVLGIFSKEALELIKTSQDGWESMVPDFVDRIIKENRIVRIQRRRSSSRSPGSRGRCGSSRQGHLFRRTIESRPTGGSNNSRHQRKKPVSRRAFSYAYAVLAYASAFSSAGASSKFGRRVITFFSVNARVPVPAGIK